ncbi:hypothetical protein GGS23DRAFT_595033 [Durotheca rogersii]|uniref:uncharacterized protein n=1 Tax=Durotheca rogersii TaxID=419775 RepID=UPI0022208FFB|nr:uncharacterized protein GGS23DRAFT_595033 [Durotheca rogersii]KAI5865514.1 hypothetical protein GGS23DRAFT_595033 [Durotheca rogersii]
MTAEYRRRGLQDSAISLDAVLTPSSDVAADPSSAGDATIPTSPRAHCTESAGESGQAEKDAPSNSVHSPLPRSETRSTRSTSTTSRNSNRLSLTLPIAPPDSAPSRPTPSSSVPPTPIEMSALSSPTDPNDFIIAIAAQDRRVLVLREELAQAEIELKRLKKQWESYEAYKRRAPTRNFNPHQPMSPLLDGQRGGDLGSTRFASELERRKAILRAQSQATPRDSKRTIISGGHTRTLSLLSPTRSTSGDPDERRSVDLYPSSPALPSPALLSKRATWAPRQSQPTNGMKQIANDFKQGLWTFVEDLRQVTIGDEAISGLSNRTSDMGSRPGRIEGDQDTIRASATSRGQIPVQSDSDSAETPSRSSTGSFSDRYQHRRTSSKPEPKAKKRFSWTPLTYDNFDDEDWSNWDTPNVKTARWSGSTVNGDIIPAIPERAAESEGTLRRKPSRSELRSPSPQTPSKLELPQAILSRLTPLTPGNIIKEWEKSLSPPAESTSF